MNNILLRMPNWVGDFVMATPLIKELKRLYPNARLTVLCKSFLKDLVVADPLVDAVIDFQKKPSIKVLKEKKFDLGILCTNSISTARHLKRAGIPKVIGYSSFLRKLFLTHSLKKISKKQPIHHVERYLKLLNGLGRASDIEVPYLHFFEKDQKKACELLRRNGVFENDILIGLNISAAYGDAKCWPKPYFKKLMEMLLKHEKVKVIFFGLSSIYNEIEEMRMGNPSVINLAGKTTLQELVCCISLLQGMISNDSGPMHIASALKIPLIAIFGSTSPILTGPYNGGKVIESNLSCSPCFKRVCKKHDTKCLKNILPETLYQEAKKLFLWC